LKVGMLQATGLEEILIVGLGPATEQLVAAFNAKGLNARAIAEQGNWESLDPHIIKAVVVCKPATTQAAIGITQRLSRMHLGPIWTVLNVVQTDEVHTQGTYHVNVLVAEVADAISAARPLDAQNSLACVYAPQALVGQCLDAAYLQTYQGITLLGVQRAGQACVVPTPNAPIELGDCYVVSGSAKHITSFTHTPLCLVAGAASW
jgi:hypothetical protein